MDDVSIAEMKTQEESGNKHMIPSTTNINRVIGDIVDNYLIPYPRSCIDAEMWRDLLELDTVRSPAVMAPNIKNVLDIA